MVLLMTGAQKKTRRFNVFQLCEQAYGHSSSFIAIFLLVFKKERKRKVKKKSISLDFVSICLGVLFLF